MSISFDAILDSAIAAVTAERSASHQTKTSSAAQPATAPTEAEKLSAVRDRNDDYRRLGVFLATLGTEGFEKAAMDTLAGGAEVVTDDPSGLPAPVATHAVAASIASGGTVPPSRSAGGAEQPTTHTPSRGGEGANTLIPPTPGQASTSPPDGEGKLPRTRPEDGKDRGTKGAEGSVPGIAGKVSGMTEEHALQLLRFASGDAVIRSGSPRDILSRYKMSSARDVVAMLKRSADARGMSLAVFLERSDFSDLQKTQEMAEFARARVKASSSDPDQYRTDLATAKDAVEAAIQATGTLPTGSDIVRTTGVDPAVAATAQMEVAQTIVAAGGSIAAPAGVTAPSPTDMTMAAAMPPAPGMAPTPDVAVPPQGAAPMDPSMMQPPAPPMPMAPAAPPAAPPMPMDPSMAAPAPQEQPKQSADTRDLLRRFLDGHARKMSEGVIANREEPQTGPPSPKEQAVTDGAAPEGSGTYEMTASEREIADALATNQSTIDFSPADAEAKKKREIDGKVDTATDGPSDKGILTSDVPVKGTKDGGMAEKESDDLAARIRAVAATAVQKGSAVRVATGRGSQEVVAAGANIVGGKSDIMPPRVKKAYDYVRENMQSNGKTPDVEAVMAEAGVSLDDAKTGIALASNG